MDYLEAKDAVVLPEAWSSNPSPEEIDDMG